MFSISEQIGQVVAADTQSSMASLNSAVIAQARLCATVVEASDAAALPAAAAQRVLDSLTSGMRDLVASRADLIQTVRALNAVQGRSNLRETAFGCPTGPHRLDDEGDAGADFFTSAQTDGTPVAATPNR